MALPLITVADSGEFKLHDDAFTILKSCQTPIGILFQIIDI